MRTCKCGCLKSSPRDVILHPGVDDNYVVGYCHHCEKKYVFKKSEIPEEKFNAQDYLAKKERKKPFSGYSKWRDENGQFQAREGR